MADIETHGERTRARILATGLDLMRVDPGAVSARRIGKALGLTHSAVLYHYGDVAGLRAAIARHAIDCREAGVIRYLIVTNNSAAAALSDSERRRYMGGVG